MNVFLLAVAAPVTGGWTPAWGIVMVVCNVVAIALEKQQCALLPQALLYPMLNSLVEWVGLLFWLRPV